jgi:septal ring factor EnvC (AmiA/AmiB activator)
VAVHNKHKPVATHSWIAAPTRKTEGNPCEITKQWDEGLFGEISKPDTLFGKELAMSRETDNLIIEHLKGLRNEIGDSRTEVTQKLDDITLRVSSLESHVAALRRDIALIHEDIAVTHLRLDHIEKRVEQIERRLDLTAA